MLRLRKLTDYATVIMAHLAREPDQVAAASEVAAAIGVATPTVSKILKMLANALLVQSMRGAQGGYRLARPAGKISVAEIIDAVEGPLAITECCAIGGLCTQEDGCAIRNSWQRINALIHRSLDTITLAEFSKPAFRADALDTGARRVKRQRLPA
jgi:FeS assembly SUF system regulator